MSKRDYYEVLGVSRDVSSDQLKRAFKKLARKFHPDVNPGNKSAEERFKEISEAYAVLSDNEKRHQYDTMGHSAFAGGNPWESGVNVDDIFKEFGFGDIFGSFFGGQRGRTSYRSSNRGVPINTKGEDVNYSMEIGFDDALRGLETVVTVPKNVINNGVLTRVTERIKVKIPAGVSSGSRVRLAGQGEPSQSGGKNGDLYILTKVSTHPYVERKGANLYIDLPLTLGELSLGTRVELETFEGITKVTIPPGTQNGQRLRLNGKGVPHMKGTGKGDLYVVVNLKLPKRIDDKSKDLIREFERLNPIDPRDGMNIARTS
ncbi:MAG: DnaJ C-terminal domain-containing protein [Nitrospinota bacterium]|nr:DnaJ C-terminal domain-containing protein [Nitrospinota bacterium]